VNDQPGGFGQPAPGYGQPNPGGYAAPPPPPAYGTAYGAPQAYAAQPPYANWGQRVLSALIDYFAPVLVAGIFYAANKPLGTILYIAAIAWSLYMAYLGGSTGQSYGKKTIGLRLISERTGQTIGGGMGIARYFLHIVDGLPCYLGYLWPLWDAKRQTFSDKIVSTIVVKV
jgi:uncharacterized RDD family membrane protein YckC